MRRRAASRRALCLFGEWQRHELVVSCVVSQFVQLVPASLLGCAQCSPWMGGSCMDGFLISVAPAVIKTNKCFQWVAVFALSTVAVPGLFSEVSHGLFAVRARCSSARALSEPCQHTQWRTSQETCFFTHFGHSNDARECSAGPQGPRMHVRILPSRAAAPPRQRSCALTRRTCILVLSMGLLRIPGTHLFAGSNSGANLLTRPTELVAFVPPAPHLDTSRSRGTLVYYPLVFV